MIVDPPSPILFVPQIKEYFFVVSASNVLLFFIVISVLLFVTSYRFVIILYSSFTSLSYFIVCSASSRSTLLYLSSANAAMIILPLLSGVVRFIVIVNVFIGPVPSSSHSDLSYSFSKITLFLIRCVSSILTLYFWGGISDVSFIFILILFSPRLISCSFLISMVVSCTMKKSESVASSPLIGASFNS